MDWLLRFDQDVFRAIHEGWRHPVMGAIMWVLSYSGLSQIQALGAIACLTREKAKFFTLPLLITILVAGLPVAQLIKKLIPRERPANLAYSVPEEAWLFKSFPSGHTTTAFAVATMLFLMTRGSSRAWIGQVALGWALLVGISRIYRGVHWPTDVLAGACAGVFSACLVFLVLGKLGHQLGLDEPEANLDGRGD